MAAAVHASDDPELDYLAASHLAYCGMADPALALFSHAVEHNFCSVSGLENNPLLGNLRRNSRFAALVSQAGACRQRFIAGGATESNRNHTTG